MRGAMIPVLLLAAMLPGCIDVPIFQDGKDSSPALGFGAMSSLPERAGPRSLDEAPEWAAGEWWTYRLEAFAYNEEAEVTIVAAGADGGKYYVGQPADDEQILPFIMHIPGTGQIYRFDLSHEAHDRPWKLLHFPLKEGLSWPGAYWGGTDMNLKVTGVDGSVATIELTAEGRTATITYDAEVGYFRSYEETLENGVPNYKLELLDHGFNYSGPVRIAYDQDLLICHGTASVAIGIADCAVGDPGPPLGTFEIPYGYDAATYALVANPGMVEDENAPGYYEITVTDPQGNTQELVVASAGGGGAMSYHSLSDPAGVWEYEAIAVGGGFAIVEGITHQVLEVELPAGCVLSHGEELDLPACAAADA